MSQARRPRDQKIVLASVWVRWVLVASLILVSTRALYVHALPASDALRRAWIHRGIGRVTSFVSSSDCEVSSSESSSRFVFVGSERLGVAAFEERGKSGSLLWRYFLPESFSMEESSNQNRAFGAVSALHCAQSRLSSSSPRTLPVLIAGAPDRSSCLYTLSAKTGRLRWSHCFSSEKQDNSRSLVRLHPLGVSPLSRSSFLAIYHDHFYVLSLDAPHEGQILSSFSLVPSSIQSKKSDRIYALKTLLVKNTLFTLLAVESSRGQSLDKVVFATFDLVGENQLRLKDSTVVPLQGPVICTHIDMIDFSEDGRAVIVDRDGRLHLIEARTSLVEIRQVSWKREGMSCKVRILSQLSSVVFSCPDIQRSEPLGAEFSNRMKRLLAFIPKDTSFVDVQRDRIPLEDIAFSKDSSHVHILDLSSISRADDEVSPRRLIPNMQSGVLQSPILSVWRSSRCQRSTFVAVSYMDGRFCLFVDDKETPLATVISSLWCRDESVAMVDSPSSSKVFDLSAPFVSSEDGVSSSSIFDRFAAQKTFLVNLWTSGSQKLASLLSHISGQSSLLSTPEDLSSTMRGSNRKKIDREFGLVSATLLSSSLCGRISVFSNSEKLPDDSPQRLWASTVALPYQSFHVAIESNGVIVVLIEERSSFTVRFLDSLSGEETYPIRRISRSSGEYFVRFLHVPLFSLPERKENLERSEDISSRLFVLLNDGSAAEEVDAEHLRFVDLTPSTDDYVVNADVTKAPLTYFTLSDSKSGRLSGWTVVPVISPSADGSSSTSSTSSGIRSGPLRLVTRRLWQTSVDSNVMSAWERDHSHGVENGRKWMKLEATSSSGDNQQCVSDKRRSLLPFSDPFLVGVAVSVHSASPSSLVESSSKDSGSSGAGSHSVRIMLLHGRTGRVLGAWTFPGTTGPVRLSVCGDTIRYSLWSLKSSRAEIGIIELSKKFSSRSRSSTGWSSQSYIVPQLPVELLLSSTRFGVGQQQVFVCYSSGQMQLIDSRLLSASRPRITVDGAMLQSTFASLNLSGPGIPPYLPVLPLEPERMVTYNISIPGLQYCSVRPVGLESSQQVLVVGIDVYFNIVPLTLTSFDELGSNFNVLIMLVTLSVIFIGTWITGHLSKGREAYARWR